MSGSLENPLYKGYITILIYFLIKAKFYCINCFILLIFFTTYPTGTYCQQPNMAPLLPLSNHNDSLTMWRCAVICQHTDSCLGFDRTMEGMCKFVQTSPTNTYNGSTIKPELVYYERCWSISINMWPAIYMICWWSNLLLHYQCKWTVYRNIRHYGHQSLSELLYYQGMWAVYRNIRHYGHQS